METNDITTHHTILLHIVQRPTNGTYQQVRLDPPHRATLNEDHGNAYYSEVDGWEYDADLDIVEWTPAD